MTIDNPSCRAGRNGRVSIVLVTYNLAAITRACLDHLDRFTDWPHDVIVVDNASSDGTVAMLQARPEVKLIRNTENLGFPRAANQGIAAASGDAVVLLNNDVLVTAGWLRRLMMVAESGDDVGMVGPRSDNVSGVQRLRHQFNGRAALHRFARYRALAHSGRMTAVDRLVGFCVLVRRAVIDAIGVLDERFGIGTYEDDDYCVRALRAGFRLVMAEDVFVHHIGSSTFRAHGTDLDRVMATSRAAFIRKWRGEPTVMNPQAPQARDDRATLGPPEEGSHTAELASHRGCYRTSALEPDAWTICSVDTVLSPRICRAIVTNDSVRRLSSSADVLVADLPLSPGSESRRQSILLIRDGAHLWLGDTGPCIPKSPLHLAARCEVSGGAELVGLPRTGLNEISGMSRLASRDSLLAQGVAKWLRGDHESATDDLARAAQLSLPDDRLTPILLSFLADCYFAMNRLSVCLNVCGKGLFSPSASPHTAALSLLQARIFVERGDRHLAGHSLTRALSWKNLAGLPASISNCVFDTGAACWASLDEWREAEACLRLLLANKPEHPWAGHDLFWLLARGRREDLLSFEHERRAALAGGHREALDACLRWVSGDPAGASGALLSGLRDTEYGAAHMCLWVRLAEPGRVTPSEFRGALGIVSISDAQAALRLAHAAAHVGDTASELALIREAVHRAPHWSEASRLLRMKGGHDQHRDVDGQGR